MNKIFVVLVFLLIFTSGVLRASQEQPGGSTLCGKCLKYFDSSKVIPISQRWAFCLECHKKVVSVKCLIKTCNGLKKEDYLMLGYLPDEQLAEMEYICGSCHTRIGIENQRMLGQIERIIVELFPKPQGPQPFGGCALNKYEIDRPDEDADPRVCHQCRIEKPGPAFYMYSNICTACMNSILLN